MHLDNLQINKLESMDRTFILSEVIDVSVRKEKRYDTINRKYLGDEYFCGIFIGGDWIVGHGDSEELALKALSNKFDSYYKTYVELESWKDEYDTVIQESLSKIVKEVI